MWDSKTFVKEDSLHQQITEKFKVYPTVYCTWPLDHPLVNSRLGLALPYHLLLTLKRASLPVKANA